MSANAKHNSSALNIQISKYKSSMIGYSGFGMPSQVVSLREREIFGPKENEVLIKVIAAPIHPVDILTIKNEYPIVPTEFPVAGGSECVGDIVEVGADVKTFSTGDRVIVPFPAPVNIGTWTTLANYPINSVMRFSDNIAIPEAATFSLNPATAYVMLKEFVNLEPGDTVIQNAANSSVGQVVHQLCKKWGVNSVGIVRKRSDTGKYKEICDYLKKIGASEIISPEELKTTDIFDSKYKKPKLALNAVGGNITELMASHLENKGVLVTYGAMTDHSVQAKGFRFIINDISFRGFWITDWLNRPENNDKKNQMYNELLKLITAGELKAPIHEMVNIKDFSIALNSTMKSYSAKKFIIDFRN